MLLLLTATLSLVIGQDVQTPEVTPRATASGSSNPAGMVIARGPTLTGETKTICRRERPQDSNIPQRVCRVVPVNSSQRSRVNDDHVREMQRIPYNSEAGFSPRASGGRQVF